MKSYREFLEEDMPTNNAGSGNVAGIGVGPEGEPGVYPQTMEASKKRRKRKKKGKRGRVR